MRFFNKGRSILSGIFCIIIFTASTQWKHNFSGNWALNIEQSDFDTLKPDIAPKQIVVVQNHDSIVVTRTFEHPGKAPNSYAQSFYFNGKTSERTGGKERRVTTISFS